ncbi:MAG: hypothetical protein JKX80_00110 [Candidatus Pacebacteria bacterium]|nr:hypothetical protein [Candidatus Paceibacterota bacterium]
MELEAVIALTILFELITVLLRLILKLRSHAWQERIGMPRIHHGYFGMLLLLTSYAFPGIAVVLWTIGWALIISDLVHHYTVLPLLRITEIDIEMQHYGVSETAIYRKVLITFAVLLVVAILSSVATTLWFAIIAMVMIYVSEGLQKILPKFKCPQEIAKHFE